MLLTMPYHSYITNNINNTSNTYTYNTNSNFSFVSKNKKKREGKPALLLSVI